MNDFQDDEALARLRGADPAKGAHPDLHRISERLRTRTPLGSAGPTSATPQGFSLTQTSDTAVRVNDPGARTGRGGLLVAASVAALAMAGGGFALGANVAGGDDSHDTVAAQDEPDQSDSQTESADNLAAADAESFDSEQGWGQGGGSGGYLGPVVPVAGDGLSTEGTSGSVYAPAKSADGTAADQLQSYAEGLGLEGSVQDYGSGADLTDAIDGRSLHFSRQGGLASLDYNNPALDPWCQETMDQAETLDYSPFGEGGPEEIECATLDEPPGDSEAITAAQELLDQAGVDYSGYTFEVESGFALFDDGLGGGDAASATAEPESLNLDDYNAMLSEELSGAEERTDVSIMATDPDMPVSGFRTWHFSVTSAGVAHASVQLGDVVELGDYPVISAAEAVERATDSRFQQLGVYIPDLEYDGSYIDQAWEDPEPLPPVEPGGPIPFPLGEATVTGAELHTGVLTLWDGTEYLVPAWNLTDGEGNSWQVLGLTEESLDLTP